MIRIKTTLKMTEMEMRAAYCETLIDLAAGNNKIVVLDCDLSNSVGTKDFYARYPERAFNCGIMEANAVGVSAGLSLKGFVPFLHSFAVFSSRRMCDHIFQSCAYAGLNVKIIGCDAGISAEKNGGTHMAFEDFGVLRSIPALTLVEPTDPVMLKAILPQLTAHHGVIYMRTPRKNVIGIYEADSEFTLGKAALLAEGTDVSIIAGGMMVSEALAAAGMLAQQGISARVLDLFTVKPVDAESVRECAEKTGAIVTAENHNIVGGIGSAVAEALVETCPVPMERVGVKDTFGDVGDVQFLREKYGLRAKDIAAAAHRVIKRKKSR
jgi:transketolase